MEILFLILKALGILLAVLLLLVIVFLSVPVRYGFNIKAQDEVEGKAVIHWLFHLVDVRIFYRQKDVSFRLRILGIPIPLNKEKPEKDKKGKPDKRKEKKAEKSSGKQAEENPSEEKETLSLPEEAEKDTRNSVQTEREEPLSDTDMLPSEEEDREQKGKKEKRRKRRGRKQSSRSGKKSGRSGGKDGFQGLGQRAQDIRTGTATVKEQIENIKNMILEETNQNALRVLLGEVRYLLRHYSPKKVYGTVRFAMKNPDQTGKVLGAISLFPGWSRYRIVVMPDFAAEDFYLKGNISVKGHIRILHVPLSGFRLITNKNIRQLIKNIRK